MFKRKPRKKLTSGPAPWQRRWYEVIFEDDTPAGKAFDVGLLLVILVSIVAVMIESLDPELLNKINPQLESWLNGVEWGITILFCFEYLARVMCVAKPSRYIFSFFGIVDLLALLPSYLGLYFDGTDALTTIRTLRLLRVFRIFKMGQHVSEANLLLAAMRRTWPKITVFLSVIFCAIVILGSVMFLVERDVEGSDFDNIPRSIYWAIVTITTVGYGDIAPKSVFGQSLAAVVMLFGYAIIIVPVGIFSAEVISHGGFSKDLRVCSNCSYQEQDTAANYCNRCGQKF